MKEPSENISLETDQSSTFSISHVENVPTGKRRSFASRKSLCSNDIGGVDCNSVQNKNDTKEVEAQEKRMKEYMEKLKIEKEGWRKLYQTRRTQYKLLRKKSEPLKLDWNSCADILSDEDKLFLQDKPDYGGIISKFHQLEEMAAIHAHKQQMIAHVNNSVLTVMEEQLAEERKKVFKHLD